MEPDESIDLVDSAAANAYGSVVAKKEQENPCEHLRRDPSVTLRKFSRDTTAHGIRITKRPAV